jgi:predicted ArsR family transcriptional regulator
MTRSHTKNSRGSGDDAHKQEANNLYDILRSNEFAAYEYIKGEGEASSAQIAKKLDLTTRATRNILHKLMEKGLVEAGGYGSTRRYAITK